MPKKTRIKPDNSPAVHQRDVIKTAFDIKELRWTEKQKALIDLAADKHTQIVFINGRAGTSKTTVAIYTLLKSLSDKMVSDLLLIRSVVESADNKMGYLPGLAEDKLMPYLMPFFDKLDRFVSKSVLDMLQKDNRVSACPVSFLRGLDWNRRGIVIDESQNLSRKELLTVLTRIGKFNKVFVIGDTQQSDIKNSGFAEVFNLFNNDESRSKGIFCFEFGPEDVMRSELCKYITEKFDELKANLANSAHRNPQDIEWRPTPKN